jgi:hypothetical protein
MSKSAYAGLLTLLLCGLTTLPGRSQTTITLDLINADNNSVIQILGDGDTLDLNLLPTNLSIEE